MRLLRLGDQGEDVKDIQLALKKRGYNLKGTGYFGGATDTAVTDFQRKNGLEADGVVGPATIKELIGTIVPDPSISDRPLWLIAGLKSLGTDEVQGSGNNPKIMQWALEEGGAIAKNYTADKIPWCSLWANMTLTKVALKGTETLWALDFHSDTKWPNVELDGPAVGAFAPMVRDGGGHIIIIVGRTANGMLAGIGGNQSDSVTIAAVPLARPKSFRWPSGVSLPSRVGFETLPIVSDSGMILSRKES